MNKILKQTDSQYKLAKTGVMWSYLLLVTNLAAEFCTVCSRFLIRLARHEGIKACKTVSASLRSKIDLTLAICYLLWIPTQKIHLVGGRDSQSIPHKWLLHLLPVCPLEAKPPSGPTNSNGLTLGTLLLIHMNNALSARLCMFQCFDLHHGRHLHLWEDCTIGESLLLTVLACGICGQVRDPFSLNHPWNIYHHNLSPLDQLYTCHWLAINYLCAPNKHLTHWFLSLIWDGYTGRDFLLLDF